MANSDSDDEMPLALLKYKRCTDSETCHTKVQLPVSHPEEIDEPSVTIVETVDGEPVQSVFPDDTWMPSDASSDEFPVYDYDFDRDPDSECEVRQCRKEVWAACPECKILLCFDHFNKEITSCLRHRKSTVKYKKKTEFAAVKAATIEDRLTTTGRDVETPLHLETTFVKDVNQGGSLRSVPEEYTVEEREKRESRKNKQKEAKRKRNLGQEYISIKTKKAVPAKQMKARCRGDTCIKQKKECTTVTDQQRQAIFDSYYSLGDLRLQREYLVRHINCCETKRKYTDNESSRRSITKQYMLPVGESLIPVCKVFFFNTLGISEQSSRTALSKLTKTGTVEEDKRGGRQSEAERQRDASLRKSISDHIDRFPKVESHYCREKNIERVLVP